MIEHNRVDADGLRIGDLFNIGNSAIHRNDQFDILAFKLVDNRDFQSIAFLNSVRNVIRHMPGQFFNEFIKNDNRGDSVRIIVAVDNNFFAGINGFHQPADTLFHVLHQKRAVQIIEGRMKITVRIFQAGNMPVQY